MLNLLRPQSRRRVRRAFESTWTGQESGGRLEDRALTAPAFFMRQPGWAGGRQRVVTASIGGVGGQMLPLTVNTGATSASISGQGVQTQFGTTAVTITGLASGAWVDNDNLGTTPVGSFTISGTTASQLSGSHPGPTSLPSALGTNVVSQRTYALADTASPSVSPVTLVETYHVTYAAAAGPTFTSNMTATLTTPTVGNFIVMGDQTGVWGVRINGGLPIAVGTSVIGTGATLPGALPSTFAFGSTSMGASITITTVFPTGVPSTAASTPPNTNPVNGVDFRVGDWLNHNMNNTSNGPPMVGPRGATGLSTATTSYEAHFYA